MRDAQQQFHGHAHRLGFRLLGIGRPLTIGMGTLAALVILLAHP